MCNPRYVMSEYALVKLEARRQRSLVGGALRQISRVAFACVACVCLFFGSVSLQANELKAQPQLPTIAMLIDGKSLDVEVAVSNQQRYMGLSFRESMDTNAGMLFVYPAERQLTFTMRNTLIPLSIAFISEDMVINEIHHMNVGPGQLFDSKMPAKFALEVNQGWFEKNGIKPGAAIVLK